MTKPTTPSNNSTGERVEITCADGVRLQGHFVAAHGETPKGLPVLLCPATGVKQHYYLKFVNWLAGH